MIVYNARGLRIRHFRKGQLALTARILLAALLALLCTGCGNVGTAAPTPAPQPVEIQAQLVPPDDVLLVITNNAPEPLALGGWSMQVTPVMSPTLVAPATLPSDFSIAGNQSARVHTVGGQNTADTLYIDTTSGVPAAVWDQGILVELRDPKSDTVIKRYIYGYNLDLGK
jgi:hypothetical protein